MARSLVLASFVVASGLLVSRAANARCIVDVRLTPEGDPLAIEVSLPVRELPKGLGIPLTVEAASAVDEASLRAKVTMEVRTGGKAIGGSLRRLPAGTWFWEPETPLPVGKVEVTFAAAAPTHVPGPATIEVVDRTLSPAMPDLAPRVGRTLVWETTGPVIVCRRTTSQDDCARSPEWKIPIKAHGVPSVIVPAFPVPTDDRFVETVVDVFGRDPSEAEGPVSSTRHDSGFGYSVDLDRAYAEYCVRIRKTPLGPNASPVVTTRCVPGSVDLAVSSIEVDRKIEDGKAGCDELVYPDGTTEDRTDDGGCRASRERAKAPWSLAAIGLVLCVLRRRRAAS